MAKPKTLTKSVGALAGMAAACAMAASPASAAELPTSAAPISLTSGVFESDPVFDIFTHEAETAEHHRYRRYRGYRRGWRRHRRVDAGDVVAGVLILGGIAAIASAASNNKRERRDRDYDYRDRDYRDRDRRGDRRNDRRYDGGSGIDSAVSQCVNRIERDVRVDAVDSVDRTGEGWRVQGSLYDGERFTCRIGNDGRVEGVDYGGGFSGVSADGVPVVGVADGQLSDDRYAQARRRKEMARPGVTYTATPVRPTPETSAEPAYPGGPLPGEQIDGDLGG
ncbi:MAG: hypothetical protein AAGL68_03880 [Pseudomonadota bacterium]